MNPYADAERLEQQKWDAFYADTELEGELMEIARDVDSGIRTSYLEELVLRSVAGRLNHPEAVHEAFEDVEFQIVTSMYLEILGRFVAKHHGRIEEHYRRVA